MNVKIKICGLRHEAEIGIVNELRPDYIGFVFAPKSKRFIAPEHAGILKSKLGNGIKTVGVFMNNQIDSVAMAVELAGLDMVQLHGDETEEYIASLREYISCPIMKAFVIKKPIDTEKAMYSRADYILLDAGTGDGKIFDWSMLSQVRRPYFLAGGLTPENVTKALELKPQPFAVDVSSGVESNRLKDYRKVMKFIINVREYRSKKI